MPKSIYEKYSASEGAYYQRNADVLADMVDSTPPLYDSAPSQKEQADAALKYLLSDPKLWEGSPSGPKQGCTYSVPLAPGSCNNCPAPNVSPGNLCVCALQKCKNNTSIVCLCFPTKNITTRKQVMAVKAVGAYTNPGTSGA